MAIESDVPGLDVQKTKNIYAMYRLKAEIDYHWFCFNHGLAEISNDDYDAKVALLNSWKLQYPEIKLDLDAIPEGIHRAIDEKTALHAFPKPANISLLMEGSLHGYTDEPPMVFGVNCRYHFNKIQMTSNVDYAEWQHEMYRRNQELEHRNTHGE